MPPPTQRLQRRLAAVLLMDVAGYSRLSETDALGTVNRMGVLFELVIEPALREADGRIVKRTGDGALCEFPGVTQAVQAAARIQSGTNGLEQDRVVEQRIQLRIGINLGEVIVDTQDNDIYGDGVNIAARLEALGQPGDIILSDAAVQSVDRTAHRFVDLGIQRLKNIARPVRAFRLVQGLQTDDAEAQAATAPVGRYQDRPAIAVLPVKPGSDDPTLTELAEELTENLIGAISRWRSFPVAPANAVRALRGRDVDVRALALQLGVRFVVETSLRSLGGRLRARVQFTDIETMDSLLSEQFEQDADDPFRAVDELVLEISGGLEPQIIRYERERAPALPPEQATPYECMARGLWHHFRYIREDSEQAERYFRRVLELDPTHGQAAAALAVLHGHRITAGWFDDRRAALEACMAFARDAVRFDPRDPNAHFALAHACIHSSAPREALEHYHEAIRLHPTHVAALANLGQCYNYIDRPELALPQHELAVRLGRHDTRLFLWQSMLATTYYLLGRYRDALVACQRSLSAKPDYPVALRYLVASLGQLGRVSEAAGAVRLLAGLDKGLAGTDAYLAQHFVDSARRRIVEGLAKAGLG
jgi:adenylate cyclase